MNRMLSARVMDGSTTTGTGTYTLTGTSTAGNRNFASAGFTSGQLVYYTAALGTGWEQGIGVLTIGAPSTLSRLAILQSSNANAAVNWGAGTKDVFCDICPDAFYEPETNIWQPQLERAAPITFFLCITGTSYYVYVGRTSRPYTAAFVEFQVSTVGAGAQTAEVGLFSSPLAPNKTGQTLTKLAATGTLDTLTSGTGVKRNTASLAASIPGGTHLWAAIRTAMATTQPTCTALFGDMGQAHIVTATGTGALTGISSVGPTTVLAASTASQCPDLRVTNS